ncbi:hypothetical protein EDE15_2544 [Edaphobacter aggregans]|uniref:Uncharacterized protein n=1 Tax=Edaphobacter aggregans TaxID=570835 RepID=A0A3R9NYS8_9BACT|nr:hypothetical protein [Edaphobacter aggregans]RSL17016.1 hypothetical protein EDE15_2544 [Edaphobacter aggregans]
MADLMVAVRRAADVLLRGCGGRTVLLRVPAPGVAGNSAEQLGLTVPRFQDVELGPVVFRRTRVNAAEGKAVQREVLVSASAVEVLTGSLGFSSASVLFATAFGVLVDEALLTIVSATEMEAGGVVCGYRLLLREAAALEV